MKIFIADDHPLYRMALSGLLGQLGDGVDIVDCSSFEDLKSVLSSCETFPDLILLDLFMPGMDYQDAIAELKSSYPDIKLAIVSGSEDVAHMSRVLKLGAEGFIPKSANHDVLLSAIRLVLSGGKYIPSQIFSGENASKSVASHHYDTEISDKGPTSLTKRQRNVLDLMAKGQSNKEIASALNLAESTVKVHITAIFRTLGVTNRTQAVLQLKEYA